MELVKRKFAKGNMTIGGGSNRRKVQPGDTVELSAANIAICEHMLAPLHPKKEPEEVEVTPAKASKGR